MPIGRNDPCPCGSGKKFKKCHGAQMPSAVTDRPGAARARTLKALDVELGERLQRFALMRFGPTWLAKAFDSYLEIEGGTVPDVELQIAIPWAIYGMPTSADGLTLAEVWRLEQAKHLTPDRRLLLDAYAASWLSAWEVADVERGVGTSLVDLLTREERFVHDVSSSMTLQRRDTLLAFVLDCGDVSFFGGVHAQPLPPREADLVAREARRLCGVRTRPVPVDKLRDVDVQLELISLWNYQVDAIHSRPPPVMQNTDGDPFVVTTDDFELLAPRDEVAQRLESIEGAETPEQEGNDVVVAITRPGNAQHREWDNTLIGRIVLTASRLRAETNSTRRADALRATIERHLDRMVRFRLRTESNTKDLIEKARASATVAQRPAAGPLPPEAVAAVRAFRERHMTAWLDDSIPALGGLTPREAARLPRARPELEVLLKEIERSEARLPPEEQLDVRRLRTALGL